MIILRKLFGIRDIHGNDPLPSPLFLPESSLENKYGKIRVFAENSGKYTKDQQRLGLEDKRALKKLRKDIIREKHYYDDGDTPTADTHYLRDLTKHPSESHLLSKSINGKDRLVYRIYKPRLVEDIDTGETMYIQKIVFESCYGHDTNGQGKY